MGNLGLKKGLEAELVQRAVVGLAAVLLLLFAGFLSLVFVCDAAGPQS